MNKYAIIVTADIKLLPGVMALINGIRYYGNDVDVYLLYWDGGKGVFERKLDNIKTQGGYDFLNLIDLGFEVSCSIKEDSWLYNCKPKFYLKFWRHYYPENLLDYKAIAIFDADMLICNNIMQYFEIAEKTGRILIPRNTGIHAQEIDNYSNTAFKASYSPPCHSMPLFYDPKIYYQLFAEIPELAYNMGRGEMVAINKLFHDKHLYKDLLLLPNSLWLGTRWKDLKYEILYGNDGIRHITIAGDRAYSIHGRWWTDEFIAKIPQDEQIGKHNGMLFNEMYKWLGDIYETRT